MYNIVPCVVTNEKRQALFELIKTESGRFTEDVLNKFQKASLLPKGVQGFFCTLPKNPWHPLDYCADVRRPAFVVQDVEIAQSEEQKLMIFGTIKWCTDNVGIMKPTKLRYTMATRVCADGLPIQILSIGMAKQHYDLG